MLFRILLGLLFAGSALAQDYPNRPVKIIVPYAPGGSTDIIGRIVAQRLTESLGQSFLVDNRPGASGNLALEAVAKAPPDGYTLLVGNVSTNAINENTFAQQLSIKPSRDLVGVAQLIEVPHNFAAAPTLAELDFAGIGTNALQGIFAPAATPKPILDKLYGSIAAILSRPEMKETLGKQMLTVTLAPPQEFTEFVRKETQGWGDFLRKAKIKIE